VGGGGFSATSIFTIAGENSALRVALPEVEPWQVAPSCTITHAVMLLTQSTTDIAATALVADDLHSLALLDGLAGPKNLKKSRAGGYASFCCV
jgi:hypothetical protein